MAMKQAGCTKVAVANDKEAYGAGLAALLELEKEQFGVDITSNTGIDPKAANFRSYAQQVKNEGADCFFFAGIVSNGAVQLTKDVNAAVPNAKIFGGDGVCTSSYTSEKDGGVPASIAPLIAVHGRDARPEELSGRQGVPRRLLKAKYGTDNPDPYAIYGYEAMKLGLDTISGLGADGQRQADGARRAVRDQGSPFGARDLRVRRERRHDADVVRPVQGRLGRQPGVLQDADAADASVASQ